MLTCQSSAALAVASLLVLSVTSGCGRQSHDHASMPIDRSADLAERLAGSWVSDDGATELHVARLAEFRQAYYVEELDPEHPAMPRRQFVWMPYQQNGELFVEHWRLTRTEDFINAWQDPERLADPLFSMYYLRHEPGCDLMFTITDWDFAGTSAGGDCDGGYGPDIIRYTNSITTAGDVLYYHAAWLDHDGNTHEASATLRRMTE